MTRSLSTTFLLLVAVAAAVAAQPLVWPASPADPMIRFEGEVRKLTDFELAIQGPTGAPKKVSKLKRPSGIAFDSRGRLLVSDVRQSALLMVDADLGVALVYGTGTTPSLREPMGVAIGADDTIYVADTGLLAVVAFDPAGEVVAVYRDDQLAEPTDVALSPDGTRIYVADAKADSIAIFDLASRQRVDTFGKRGQGAAEFHLPTAVEFDAHGSLLVVDQLNTRVQVFDSHGAFTRALRPRHTSGYSRPRDVAIDSVGRIYITDAARSEVGVFGADLDPLLEFGRNGMGEGEFLGIGAIATTGDELAVLDQAGGRILLFHLYGVDPAAAPEAAIAPVPPAGAPAPTGLDEPPMEATRLVEPATETEMPTADAGPEEHPSVERGTSGAGEAVEAEPAPAAAEATVVSPPDEVATAQQLLDRVNAWAAAWSAQDVASYLAFYADSFEPDTGGSRTAWAELRRERITSPSSIDVSVDVTETDLLGADRAEVTLVQAYSSDRYSDRVRKSLHLVRRDGAWLIERETVLETLTSP